MDGANGQLRQITTYENMVEEKDANVECCKHSAACTGDEQVADAGPMFKLMKRLLKILDIPHPANNNLYILLDYFVERIGKYLSYSKQKSHDVVITQEKGNSIYYT